MAGLCKKFTASWLLGFLAVLVLMLVCAPVTVRAKGEGETSEEKTVKKEDIHAVLEETEILKMLRDQAAQQDQKLDELHQRLERELHVMEEHFEEMFDKIHNTEESLERNLGKIEEKVFGSVQEIAKKSSEQHGSWKLPFFLLICVICGVSFAFYRMYQKATRHTHYL
uniref:t-SNARE coiled-coil homology domain-containing protein n=1 Tax=Aplanochytrium stocchinoi TaxID=215587 RepID=A0A6S8FPJ7_9STRA|mmetsp:Transcript_10262/g.12814  ORF Transcript_10262/g.12814 Transcript_10262/m.12814 type:complete len:168 (+) Transcript_10262:259-762(+)|eukprot:CAMPEP_0204850960 /NCGR_PEP_ID=MMETSP1347-20130617/9146_1 /ASSEMBLY_ACC=CAM_ASM_000690 /TAXON_ID=215587 /ORGANISM="Aplanochytrium stocchinoi, Strain GSBS06" /LENGTH=167 /DNA_ID=CAMNT_0051994267 /DNA_START=226 /DNA_END=729 /DNA_ORIENTATION=-